MFTVIFSLKQALNGMNKHFKLISFILFSITLCFGCASKPKEPVKVSYECHKIVLPPLPILPVNNLKVNSTQGEVIKAYVSSIKHMVNWSRVVKKQVESA